MRIPLRDVNSLPGPGDLPGPWDDGIDPMEEEQQVTQFIEDRLDDLLKEVAKMTVETQDIAILLTELLTTANDETRNKLAKELSEEFYEFARNELEARKNDY